MRAAPSIVATVLLTACAGPPDGGARFLSSTGAVGDFTIPVRSVLDQRYAGVIRQQYDFSCGSAALATLLRFHYGDPVGETDVFRGMWRDGDRAAIRRVGFSLLDMKRYLAARNISADGYKVGLDQIARTGLPGIALITVGNYKHFVVVKGVRSDEVLLGDPSTGLHPMSRTEFEKAWNGVFFAIGTAQTAGRRAFNQDAQWLAFARAPVGTRFADPVSLQALALTAPFYGDF